MRYVIKRFVEALEIIIRPERYVRLDEDMVRALRDMLEQAVETNWEDRTKNPARPFDVRNIAEDMLRFGLRYKWTAIDNMKKDGLEVGMVRPQTLFPFPEEQVLAAAEKACCKVVASIEMSMGQMIEDIQRSVIGKKPVHWYGKCGGDVPTPEEVTEFIHTLL